MTYLSSRKHQTISVTECKSMAVFDPHQQRILIIDFGGQYTQLIGRNVRELGVYCEIYPWDIDDSKVSAFAPHGIILSGGPDSTLEDETASAPQAVFDLGIPVLGICYGMQTLVDQLGGAVENAEHHEYGHAILQLVESTHLLGLSGEEHEVWMSHGDRVISLPPGFNTVAATSNSPHAAIADTQRHLYGVQFHPEVTHTPHGKQVLSRFIHEICACKSAWTASNIIDNIVHTVREQVGKQNVILGLSGGVDSSVVAALLHQAIGDQLTCIFVDNGLLRLHEGDQVMSTFADNLHVKVIRVNTEDRFLTALKGITDPEIKRKIIGNLFIDIFQEEALKIKDVNWLAQGTIYPDVIESAGSKHGKAKVIKSHHNVGGLPERMHLKLLEPLRELFKDEVRRIGEELGLPHKMVYRHPFPGPGLGVRILGEVRKEYTELLRQADAIFIEELYKHDLYDSISQAFAVFLPVKSVGVIGDNRAYEYVIALRAVETVDFMTANFKAIPHEILSKIASRIINEVRGISRVTYDISNKPPGTIEWE